MGQEVENYYFDIPEKFKSEKRFDKKNKRHGNLSFAKSVFMPF